MNDIRGWCTYTNQNWFPNKQRKTKPRATNFSKARSKLKLLNNSVFFSNSFTQARCIQDPFHCGITLNVSSFDWTKYFFDTSATITFNKFIQLEFSLVPEGKTTKMARKRRRKSNSSESSIEQCILQDLLHSDDQETFLLSKVRIVNKPKLPVPKSNDYWLNIFPKLANNKFSKYYRRSRASFEALCHELFDKSGYKDKNRFIKSMAMTLEYLSTATRLVDIEIKYGLALGLVHKETDQIIHLLGSELYSIVVKWPSNNERQAISQRFWEQRGLPYCCGAIDGTLVRTFGYRPNRTELNTRKCHYGFNILLVCDDQGLIREACVGEAGSQADSAILQRQEFYRDIEMKLKNDLNAERPFYLLSDKGILLLIKGWQVYPTS